MNRIKLLIDTDAGIDDSVAILLANSAPNVDIVAITTCYGTTTLENTTQNVLNLASYIGLTTKVAAGCEKPIVAPPRPVGGFHGPAGVGMAQFPPSTHPLDKSYAWDMIYQQAKAYPGELVIVTLGPLSNLGVALLKYPELPQYVKQVIIMGGSTEAGNAGVYGEANILHDPHACELVLRSGMPVVLAGLNATEDTRLTNEEYNHLFSLRTRVSTILEDMFATYKQSQNLSGETGLVIHDAAALAIALKPEIARLEKYHVTCELSHSPMYGRTIADFRARSTEEKNVDVAMAMDKDLFIAMMNTMLEFYR